MPGFAPSVQIAWQRDAAETCETQRGQRGLAADRIPLYPFSRNSDESVLGAPNQFFERFSRT